MRNVSKQIVVYLILVAMVCLAACGKKSKSIPYTQANFDSTLEEVIALEGENYETYDSIYYGTTYTYEKKFLERSGKIKYMFNDSEALCNIAWSCALEDGEQADILYKEIYAILQKDYGNPADNTGVNNYGCVWKRDDGNIILSAVISSEANIVQVAFLSPEVSRDADGKLSNDTSAPDPSEDASKDAEVDDILNVTLEDIKAANSYETLLNKHKSVAYAAMQYANEDVDDGYLGYDNTIIRIDNGDISYLSSAASQSVPFTVVIEKNEDGKYTQKTQFAGESIVETEYDSENAMKKDLAHLWYFDGNDFADEVITETSIQDDALVVTTNRTPKSGEYAADTIVRYYFLNQESLELYAINEYMPTDTAYGTVYTNTTVTYDENPDFTIELFTPEPEDTITDEDYNNMSSPDDGEE